MKITDLKCTVLGQNPIVRITTDEGISGLAEVESSKSYLKPHVLFYRPFILGEDPTDVERAMLKIRRLGSFKPWGSAVSAIEMALWDIAGKAAGLPVHKLLGGKIRDKVRVYNGGIAELKWVAEYADLHGILVAPHGVGDGLIGLAALVQVSAALPQNYIAFEYPVGRPEWWYDVVEGLPDSPTRRTLRQ